MLAETVLAETVLANKDVGQRLSTDDALERKLFKTSAAQITWTLPRGISPHECPAHGFCQHGSRGSRKPTRANTTNTTNTTNNDVM